VYEQAFHSPGSTYAEQSSGFDYITEMLHRKVYTHGSSNIVVHGHNLFRVICSPTTLAG
jgi:hypothetical protein